MYLENLVFDAVDPQRLGRSWERAVDGERLSDWPDGFETRLTVPDGPVLDLCFQRVPEPPSSPARLRPDLVGGGVAAERLHGLGARILDPPAPVGTGPLAALRMESADPDRDAAFWSWLTGWTGIADAGERSLRHPSRRGPALELWPERAPKGTDHKNPLHLDVRLEAGEDPDHVEADIAARGATRLLPDWGELPWRTYLDPSGNEFCVLPARS